MSNIDQINIDISQITITAEFTTQPIVAQFMAEQGPPGPTGLGVAEGGNEGDFLVRGPGSSTIRKSDNSFLNALLFG